MQQRRHIEERLHEKTAIQKAHRQITRLFILTSSIIFFSLLVIWIVQNFTHLILPSIYTPATVLIVLSSLQLFVASRNIKADEIIKAYHITTSSVIVAVTFSILQIIGWYELIADNNTLRNIILPFSIIHFIHVWVGIVLLIVAVVKLRNYEIHSKAEAFAKNVFLFWHFLGIVWLSFFIGSSVGN